MYQSKEVNLEEKRLGASQDVHLEDRRNAKNRKRWTAKLINNTKEWIDCKRDEINIYITHFLSGRGITTPTSTR